MLWFYSLGIPKQTETAKTKYSILDCLKENMDAGYAPLMFRTQNWEESIRVILLISMYCFLTTTDRVATPFFHTKLINMSPELVLRKLSYSACLVSQISVEWTSIFICADFHMISWVL